MTARAFPWGRLFLFFLLNLADLFLTWRLLGSADGRVYETNPFADWFLGRYGWPGMAAYKFATAAFVAGVTSLICWYRPRAGARVLTVGCAILAVVIAYSSSLPRLYGVLYPSPHAAEAALIRQKEQLDARMAAAMARYRLRRELLREFREARCTLAEAVDRLQRATEEQDPTWQDQLARTYPDCTPCARSAANFVQFCAAADREISPADMTFRTRLAAGYQQLFGRPCPSPSFGR